MTSFIDTETLDTRGGRVRIVRMARPPVNALNPELCRSLIAALEAAAADDVDGIVLAGNPKIFSAGLDVPYLVSLGDDRRALFEAWQAFFGAARMLATSRVPVVAALTGHSPAGGCVLALCSDYRVMVRSTDPTRPVQIGLNETQVGLAVPEGIQRLMRRVVGPYRTERLLMAGAMVSAEDAHALGLVDVLAEPEAVVPTAVAWLEDLLMLPRQPMLHTRSLARADILEALEPEHIPLQRFVDDWYGDDAQTALKALVAKLRK